MNVKYIPPRDPRALRINKAKATLTEVLRPFLTGKNAGFRLNQAVEAVMKVFTPILKLPPIPDKGATIMTEAASHRHEETKQFTKPPSNL